METLRETPSETVPTSSTVWEVVLACPEDTGTADYRAEVLLGLAGVLSVEVVYDGLPGEETPRGLKVFTLGHDGVDALRQLLATGEWQGVSETGCRAIQDDDWATAWKQYWHATPITETLTICPSWEAYSPKRPDETVITLDPGAAFGTGAHETTRLMLAWLSDLARTQDFSQQAFLDVGTGSGILAIAAARLGSQSVTAIDIDPAALRTARENAAINGVPDRITVTGVPLADLCRTRYDVILANILAPVILDLLPEMVLRLEPGGRLLASGLIAASVEAVEAAMTEAGFHGLERRESQGWFAVSGVYRP